MPAFSAFTPTNPRDRVRLTLALASVLVWALFAASSALASTVRVGPPLTGAYSSSAPDNVGTFANGTLEAGASVKSPVTGTVVCWRIKGATGGPFRLRVLTPGAGTTYTGGGKSTSHMSKGIAIQSFPANLPIRAGQTIGIDDSTAGDQFGFRFDAGSHLGWTGSLADGSARAANATGVGEIGLNAEVQTADGSGSESGCGEPNGGGGGHHQPHHCVVPNLKGDKLRKARERLKAADCSLGKVKGSGKKVKKQSPKAGRVLPAGSKVNVRLG